MLDIKWIRDNPQALATALTNRGWASDAAASEVEKLIALDEARRSHIIRVEAAQARRNAASKEIGRAKAAKDEAAASALMDEVAGVKALLGEAEAEGKRRDKALEDALAIVPNVPLPDVPVGPDEHANVVYRRWGELPNSRQGWGNDFKPKEHYELGEALGQMDFAAAAKLSGSRFVVLKKGLARMERALGQFMLDLHTQPEKDGLFGYEEVQPPMLVREDVLFGTGQLPKFEADQFYAIRGELLSTANSDQIANLDRLEAQAVLAGRGQRLQRAKYDFGLIPTAEVPLTNLVRESILDEAALPLRYTALTPCFRSEAGAAGKDTRGMLRQHQFDKVELVSITTPDQSAAEHERMLASAEAVLKRLDLHYRIMRLSTGDMGFASQKTYDIEAWLPGQGTYREISSCSACGDFQARRMQARYRPKGEKGTRLVHTLNGSGVAVGRALIAVMENYQNPDGSVTVPAALRPYMGGMERVG